MFSPHVFERFMKEATLAENAKWSSFDEIFWRQATAIPPSILLHHPSVVNTWLGDSDHCTIESKEEVVEPASDAEILDMILWSNEGQGREDRTEERTEATRSEPSFKLCTT